MENVVSKPKKKNRLGWIDYARGIAIILVVYKHAVVGFISSKVEIHSYLFDFQEMIYNLRMPLFFMLSGIFIERSLKRRGFSKFLKYKASTIIYPFFVWGIIQILIQIVASNYTNSQKEFSDVLYLLYYPRLIDPFWFLYTLFAVVMAYAVLKSFVGVNKLTLFVLSLGLYFVSFYIKTDLFCINDILFYSIFLVTGILLSKKLLDEKLQDLLTSPKLLLILVPIVLIGQWYWYTHHKGLVWFTDLTGIDRFLFLPIAIVGAMLVLHISFLLDKKNLLPVLRHIGSYSLYIYVMHLIVTGASRAVFLKLFGENAATFSAILVIILGVLVPILIFKITEKFHMDFLYEPPKKKVMKSELETVDQTR
ncbi:acyltransferase family protein [Flexithrix dorotheae]|uniref:acyltransferase family protein n=1 Tax=Flexithrix dorotheae TaxID=70993 RepID=UPI0003716AAB|nr:acyltransferase [Flexithrix dorotheae]